MLLALEKASYCLCYVSFTTKAYHLKEIIKPRAIICFKNLLLKRDCFSPPLATATFNDLSMACSNPKELYFTEAVRKLQNQIEVAVFLLLFLYSIQHT